MTTSASEMTTAKANATPGSSGRWLASLTVTTIRTASGKTTQTVRTVELGRWANRRLALEAGAGYAERINQAGFVLSAIADELGL